MVQFLIKIVVNAFAVWVAAAIVPGVVVAEDEDSLGRTVLTLLVIGLIFGIVNAIIKPVVKFFTFPFYILSLGLLSFIVNAAMLELVAWISDQVGITFEIDDFFWSAILAAVVVSLVSLALNIVLPDDKD